MKWVLRVWNYFRADRAQIGTVFVFMLLSVTVNLLKPWPLALIVDSVIGKKDFPAWFPQGILQPLSALSVLIVLLFLLHLAQAGLSASFQFRSITLGLRGLTRVRIEVFEWLQRLSFRFHHRSQTGDLIQRTAWDTYAFQTLFQQGLITLAHSILSLLLMIAVMWKVNPSLTWVALITVPLVVLAVRGLSPKMMKNSSAAQQADSEVTSLIQQSMALLPLTLVYTGEERERQKFSERARHAQQRRASQHGWEVLYGFFIAAIFGVGLAAVCWFGAQQVMQGELTLGGLLIFFSYLTQFYDPLNQLSHAGSTVSAAAAGAKRVFEILDTPEEVSEPREPKTWSLNPSVSDEGNSGKRTVVRGTIVFNNVSFGYQKGEKVLQEINLQIPAGEAVALIGPSGAGKTTLLNLLPRFYDPDSGMITLDGIDLREIRLKELRSQIALVAQETLVLSGSIAENIGYGKVSASDSEIEAAARSANIHDFIAALPKGYATLIGEGGSRLSAGQKQRISLARAFLKNAPIVILDEPTSALDAENEAQIVESMNRLLKGRTTLIAAHRLSTIRAVDRIIVLEGGRITQQGSPAELAALPGYFGTLARAMRSEISLNQK